MTYGCVGHCCFLLPFSWPDVEGMITGGGEKPDVTYGCDRRSHSAGSSGARLQSGVPADPGWGGGAGSGGLAPQLQLTSAPARAPAAPPCSDIGGCKEQIEKMREVRGRAAAGPPRPPAEQLRTLRPGTAGGSHARPCRLPPAPPAAHATLSALSPRHGWQSCLRCTQAHKLAAELSPTPRPAPLFVAHRRWWSCPCCTPRSL